MITATVEKIFSFGQILNFQRHKAEIKLLWWADPSWTTGADKSCSVTSQLDTGEKYNKRLRDQNKDREKSLTNGQETYGN